MSRSFRPEYRIRPPGYRSPSPPPRDAIEPLSPPPGWHPGLSAKYDPRSSKKRKLSGDRQENTREHRGEPLNGIPEAHSSSDGVAPQAYAPSTKRQSPPSALDVFAAVATSPSLNQDVNSPSVFHSPSSAAFPSGQNSLFDGRYERPSKRSRSEVYTERPVIISDSRPITSHVSSSRDPIATALSDVHLSRQPGTAPHYGVLEQDAELLLMFSRGSYDTQIFPPNPYAPLMGSIGDSNRLRSVRASKQSPGALEIPPLGDQSARESKPLLPVFSRPVEQVSNGLPDHTQSAQQTSSTAYNGETQPDPPKPREHRGWPKGKPRGPRAPGAGRKKKGDAGTKRGDTRAGEGLSGERRRGKPKKTASAAGGALSSGNTVVVSNGRVRRRRHSFHEVPSDAARSSANISASRRSSSMPRAPYAGLLMAREQEAQPQANIRGKKQRRSPEDIEFCPLCQLDSKPTPGSQELWINCNGCKAWIHAGCAGFESEKKVKDVDKFYCVKCEKQHGQTTYVRKSSRAHASVDYAGLNEGKIRAAEDVHGHHYIDPIKNGTLQFVPDTFARMPPELVTAEYFGKLGGWKEPVLIPASLNPRPKPVSVEGESLVAAETTDPDPCTGISEEAFSEKYIYHCVPDEGQDKLDMVMPHGLTVRRVAELHGPETKLAVIDVKLQEGEDKWSLSKWADYYYEEGDKPVRNVISLEVSRSKLGRLIRRPKVVRDLDLQDSVWPAEETAKGNFPRVQFYCLMSVADCYTDFHIDFGGSSVYYHILKGRKTFFFIPPTVKNLKKYEDWCKSPNQNNIFLGDETKDCCRVDLYPGDTMLIPSGWIHAVWTPEDSLVIGGNFLTPLHYAMQIQIHAIEKATEVGQAFRYPFFQKIMWLAAIRYLERDPVPSTVVDALTLGDVFERQNPIWFEGLLENYETTNSDPEHFNAKYYPEQELEGLPELIRFLHRSVLISQGHVPGITKKQQDAVGRSIPKGYGDPVELLKTFAIWVAWKRGNENIPAWAFLDAPFMDTEDTSGEKKISFLTQRRLDKQAAHEMLRRESGSRNLRPSTELASRATPEQTQTKDEVTEVFSSASPTATRPACEVCRARKRRCEHTRISSRATSPVPDQAETRPPRFGVRVTDIEQAAAAAEPEAEAIAVDTQPEEEGVSVKREASAFGASHGILPPVTMPPILNEFAGPVALSSQFSWPEPALPREEPVSTIDGTPNQEPKATQSPGSQAKKSKTKACSDCKKSKRRCVHDQNGKVDPVKAQEIPTPRGNSGIKRAKSGEDGSRPNSSKKAKRESDFTGLDFPLQPESHVVGSPLDPQKLGSGFNHEMPVAQVQAHFPNAEPVQSSREHNGRSADKFNGRERKERSRSRTSSSNQHTSGSESIKASKSATVSPLTEPDRVPLMANDEAIRALAEQDGGTTAVVNAEMASQRETTGLGPKEALHKQPSAEPMHQPSGPARSPRPRTPISNGMSNRTASATGPGCGEVVRSSSPSKHISKSPGAVKGSPLHEEEDESVRLAKMLAGQEHGLRRRG